MSKNFHLFKNSILLLAITIPAISAIATETEPENTQTAVFSQKQTFPSSLHATRFGMFTPYSKYHGGLETLTNKSIDDLGCLQCHHKSGVLADGTAIDPATYKPSCVDCHDSSKGTPGPVNSPDICLECHSRQAQEIALKMPDVHRDVGKTCIDCHTKDEMHGDGNIYSSILAPRAEKTESAKCGNCHKNSASSNSYHKNHIENIECSVCHTKTTLSCTNCHVPGTGKPIGAHTGFKMLVQGTDNQKVHSATYMSVTTNENKTFYAIAPYYSHSIIKNAITSCNDCHQNQAVQEYTKTGKITVLKNKNDQPVFTQGILPIPQNWQNALRFSFWKNDGSKWSFLKNTADKKQMLFAMPLSTQQMNALKQNVTP